MEKVLKTPVNIDKTKLDKLSLKLKQKYSRKKSDVDNSKNFQKTKAQLIWGYIGNGFAVIFVVSCIIICVSSFINIFNKSPNMIFGYSALQISSGSMTADSIEIDGKTYSSGFAIGDNIVIHPVDAHTLHIGDKIAFYAYPENYLKYHSLKKEEITLSDDPTKYDVSFGQFWGFHKQEITEASTSGLCFTTSQMLIWMKMVNIGLKHKGLPTP